MKGYDVMYYVVDYYENIEVVCMTKKLGTAIQASKERYEDTDGECDVSILCSFNEDDMYKINYLYNNGLI